MALTEQDRATRSAQAMWKDDQASRLLGISLSNVGPGLAVATMEVKAHHLNGHSICHGGFIFTLADTAFAFACNSYNQSVVAQQNSITYLMPGQLGDILTATAQEQYHKGRTGIYDVDVTSQSGAKIALFRGLSRTIAGQHFEEDTE